MSSIEEVIINLLTIGTLIFGFFILLMVIYVLYIVFRTRQLKKQGYTQKQINVIITIGEVEAVKWFALIEELETDERRIE